MLEAASSLAATGGANVFIRPDHRIHSLEFQECMYRLCSSGAHIGLVRIAQELADLDDYEPSLCPTVSWQCKVGAAVFKQFPRCV